MKRRAVVCVNLTMVLGLAFLFGGQARALEGGGAIRKSAVGVAHVHAPAVERHMTRVHAAVRDSRAERARKQYEEGLYRPCLAPCDWVPRSKLPEEKAVIPSGLRGRCPGEPMNGAR